VIFNLVVEISIPAFAFADYVSPSSQAPARLHHLDALRTAAMLLGLALHAMLAYAGIPWVPQDRVSSEFWASPSRQSMAFACRFSFF
jgi:hypothetical protein